MGATWSATTAQLTLRINITLAEVAFQEPQVQDNTRICSGSDVIPIRKGVTVNLDMTIVLVVVPDHELRLGSLDGMVSLDVWSGEFWSLIDRRSWWIWAIQGQPMKARAIKRPLK